MPGARIQVSISAVLIRRNRLWFSEYNKKDAADGAADRRKPLKKAPSGASIHSAKVSISIRITKIFNKKIGLTIASAPSRGGRPAHDFRDRRGKGALAFENGRIDGGHLPPDGGGIDGRKRM